jgi:photosystem II stability/assembly factor-like uncharacterized protein
MKKVILVLIFLITSNCFAQVSNRNYISDCNFFEHSNSHSATGVNSDFSIWNFFQTPTTSQITDVQFTGSSGWATHTSMGLVMTTNGGSNWTLVSFYDSTFTTLFNGVYFLTPLTGWTVGGALQIRKTTNGGLNWVRQIPPPLAGVLNSVYFFTANTGYAIGRKNINYNSCVLKTTDGGTIWTEVILSAANENELFDQYWLNIQTGWICGKSFLKKTTDGGLNFSDYYANVPPTSNGINALLCINFIDNMTGWIGGSNLDHKNMYRTTNGGLNWVFQDNPVSQYTYPQINDVKMLYSGTGWAAHGTPASGAILYTTNYGANWVIDNNTNTWFDCLWPDNNSQLYCGAGSGQVWYSTITSGIKQINKSVPDRFYLFQNYPNPFNPATNIRYQLTKSGNVTLKIFDINGKEVNTLLSERQSAGTYEIIWNAGVNPSGIYFYRLEAENLSQVRKMILVK